MGYICGLLLLFWTLPLVAAEVFYQVSPAQLLPEDSMALSVWVPERHHRSRVSVTGPDGTVVDMMAMSDHYVAHIPVGQVTPGKYPVLIVIQDETKTPSQYTFWVTIHPWTESGELLRRRLQEVIGRIGMRLQEKETLLSGRSEVPVSLEQSQLISQIIAAYAVRANAESQNLAERRKGGSGNLVLAEQLFRPVSEPMVLKNLETHADVLASELDWIEQFHDRPSTALLELERWRLYTIDRTHGRQDFRAFWPTSNVESRESAFDGRDAMILDHISKLRLALQRADIRIDIQRLEQRKSRAAEAYQHTLEEREKLKKSMDALTEAVKKKISQYYDSLPNPDAQ